MGPAAGIVPLHTLYRTSSKTDTMNEETIQLVSVTDHYKVERHWYPYPHSPKCLQICIFVLNSPTILTFTLWINSNLLVHANVISWVISFVTSQCKVIRYFVKRSRWRKFMGKGYPQYPRTCVWTVCIYAQYNKFKSNQFLLEWLLYAIVLPYTLLISWMQMNLKIQALQFYFITLLIHYITRA